MPSDKWPRLFACVILGALITMMLCSNSSQRSLGSSTWWKRDIVPKQVRGHILAPRPMAHIQQVDSMPPVGRREMLSILSTVAGMFGAQGHAEAFMFPGRGVEIIGWQGQKLLVPNALKYSPFTNALKDYTYPSEWPYIDIDFFRLDDTEDSLFYDSPRFTEHVDKDAISALQTFYGAAFSQAPQGEYSILDMCSSWISHYPDNLNAKRVAITGMNEAELQENAQATDYSVKDLNSDPTLPYEDDSFDFVTNAVSIDYLIKPREVMTEVHRVMKPGGLAIFSFSKRCFITKAINMWVATMEDGPSHCHIVADYFRFSPEGGWRDISCVDVSPAPGRTDDMYVVTAVKA